MKKGRKSVHYFVGMEEGMHSHFWKHIEAMYGQHRVVLHAHWPHWYSRYILRTFKHSNIVRINTKSQCIIISLQYEKKRPFSYSYCKRRFCLSSPPCRAPPTPPSCAGPCFPWRGRSGRAWPRSRASRRGGGRSPDGWSGTRLGNRPVLEIFHNFMGK